MKIGILGAGTWGNALANLLASNMHDVTVWSALPEEIDYLNEHHEHFNLPGVHLDDSISFEKDIAVAAASKDIVVFATPSQFIRGTAKSARDHVAADQICVTVAKGIEKDTYNTMSQIVEEELAGTGARLVALSGPTHAEEVSRSMPSTIVSASEDAEAAKTVQRAFATNWMRVYTNDDPVGAEYCGALKNVIALASGIANGLGCGDNARAAIITRGLDEMRRLGMAMGCKGETFYGLAGMGDLIVTASSMHSRNNQAGKLIGEGKTPDEACEEVGMVVEGLNALPAAVALGKKVNVELPLTQAVDDIVAGRKSAKEAMDALYARPLKAE